jgi:hypothetical protein
MSASIEVVINGQPRIVNQGTTIAGLIGDLGLSGKPVAVERNTLRPSSPRATGSRSSPSSEEAD